MHLSARSRYAVMALVDLAKLQEEKALKATVNEPVRLAEIAQRQEISLSYLEQIFAQLRRKEVVRSLRGPGGGYALISPVTLITIGQIVRAVEEPVSARRCDEGTGCMSDGTHCNAHALWHALESCVMSFLDKVTLDMVLNKALNVDIMCKSVPGKVCESKCESKAV